MGISLLLAVKCKVFTLIVLLQVWNQFFASDLESAICFYKNPQQKDLKETTIAIPKLEER